MKKKTESHINSVIANVKRIVRHLNGRLGPYTMELQNGQSLERGQAWGKTHKHPFPLICTKMSPSNFLKQREL